MDLNSLKDQVSNLTLYDIKAGVRKVQNGMCDLVQRFQLLEHKLRNVPAVMNYTEMEAKVRIAASIGDKDNLLRSEHRSAKPRTTNRKCRPVNNF